MLIFQNIYLFSDIKFPLSAHQLLSDFLCKWNLVSERFGEICSFVQEKTACSNDTTCSKLSAIPLNLRCILANSPESIYEGIIQY